MSNQPNEPIVQFAGGTKRSAKQPPLFLCPIELIQEVAKTRLEGDTKYEPGNWMKGDTEFFLDCNSHAITHLYEVTDPENDEDVLTHLGHAATNIAFMIWALRRGIIKREDFRNFAKYAGGQAKKPDTPIRGVPLDDK